MTSVYILYSLQFVFRNIRGGKMCVLRQTFKSLYILYSLRYVFRNIRDCNILFFVGHSNLCISCTLYHLCLEKSEAAIFLIFLIKAIIHKLKYKFIISFWIYGVIQTCIYNLFAMFTNICDLWGFSLFDFWSFTDMFAD